MSTPLVLVITNFPCAETAKHAAESLIEKKLAACVQILPPMTSLYVWENQLQNSTEIPLWIKTTQNLYSLVEKHLLILHPYEVPEITAIPIMASLASYRQWIEESVQNEQICLD